MIFRQTEEGQKNEKAGGWREEEGCSGKMPREERERDREERDVKKEREANQMIFEFNYQIYSVSGFLKTILFLTPQS